MDAFSSHLHNDQSNRTMHIKYVYGLCGKWAPLSVWKNISLKNHMQNYWNLLKNEKYVNMNILFDAAALLQRVKGTMDDLESHI